MEGIKAAITNAGLKPHDVFTREAEGFGDKKVTSYIAGKKLLAHEI